MIAAKQMEPAVVRDSNNEKPSDFLQRVMWAEVSERLI